MADQFGDSPGQGTTLSWSRRREQWRRFAAWEAEQLRSTPQDFRRALQWFADAWFLAKRSDPTWASPERAEEHWSHLKRVRRALARMRTHT